MKYDVNIICISDYDIYKLLLLHPLCENNRVFTLSFLKFFRSKMSDMLVGKICDKFQMNSSVIEEVIKYLKYDQELVTTRVENGRIFKSDKYQSMTGFYNTQIEPNFDKLKSYRTLCSKQSEICASNIKSKINIDKISIEEMTATIIDNTTQIFLYLNQKSLENKKNNIWPLLQDCSKCEYKINRLCFEECERTFCDNYSEI